MRNFIITEGQLNLLLNFLNPSKGHIHEVAKDDNFDEGHPVYRYKSIKVLPDEWNLNKVGLIFFNGPVFQETEYEIPERDRNVIFKGPQGELTIDSSLIKTSNNGKSIFLVGDDFIDSEYYVKFSDLMKPPTSNFEFSSSDINDALEIAFKEYWNPESKEFSKGLRGIHTIGEKTGNKIEDWSIMNYFDTKKEVKALIDQKWKKEGFGEKIQWLSNIFKNDDKFLEKLLDLQWNSIKSGIKTESDAISDLVNYLKNKGIEVDVEYYPPGHKTDRFGGIDFTLKPKNKNSFTIQVKPLKKIEITDSGNAKIQTYGMKNEYKSLPKLDYIVYDNSPNFLVFKNSNYEVLNNGSTVIHKDNPIDISEIK
jgi:hypothetical protein